jgi:hypothetical protein
MTSESGMNPYSSRRLALQPRESAAAGAASVDEWR